MIMKWSEIIRAHYDGSWEGSGKIEVDHYDDGSFALIQPKDGYDGAVLLTRKQAQELHQILGKHLNEQST